MKIIDKSLPIPLYYQLKELIIEHIDNGTYEEDQMIPTEFELIDKYELSRTTVRQALNELVSEGYLYRKKGVGTFVSNKTLRDLQKKHLQNNPVYQIPHMIEKQGQITSTKFLEVKEEEASDEVAEALNISIGDKVWVMDRLRYANDTLVSFSRSYLQKNLIDDFNKDAESASQNYHRYLDSKGYPIEIIDESLHPDKLNEEVSQIMGMKNKQVVMLIKDYGLLKNGKTVDYSITYLDSKAITISSIATRKPTI